MDAAPFTADQAAVFDVQDVYVNQMHLNNNACFKVVPELSAQPMQVLMVEHLRGTLYRLTVFDFDKGVVADLYRGWRTPIYVLRQPDEVTT